MHLQEKLIDELYNLHYNNLGTYNCVYEDFRYKKRVVPFELETKGKVNFNGQFVNNIYALADVFSIVRDYRFETFRVIYIKNDIVVGMDTLTSRLPSVTPIYRKFKDIDYDKSLIVTIEEYVKKYNKLNCDMFYILHNHSSGSSTPTANDMDTNDMFFEISKKYNTNFGGQVVLGENDYSIIDRNGNSKKYNFTKELQMNEPIETIKKSDIPAYGNKLIYSNDISVILYIDNLSRIRAVQEVDNYEFNNKNTLKYIYNQSIENGTNNVFLVTSNEEVYEKARKLNYTTFVLTDIIFVNENEFVSWKDECESNGECFITSSIKHKLKPRDMRDIDKIYKNK